MSKFQFLFCSVVLHCSLLALAYFLFHPHDPIPEMTKVEIQITEAKATTPAKTPGKDSLSGTVNKFLPSYSFKTFKGVSDRDGYLINPRRDNPRTQWGSGSETFERIADYNFFRQLYSFIDGHLAYPSVLARNKITGTVNARIVIGAAGNCDWQSTWIRGNNAYLELYTLDILKRVCRQNFKQMIGKREVTNADLSFRFDINENNDEERVEGEKIVIGNTLLFYRNSHQSIAEWELGPFRGIFPIPTVYLNIPWIQQNWDRLVNDKDPIKEFKKNFGAG